MGNANSCYHVFVTHLCPVYQLDKWLNCVCGADAHSYDVRWCITLVDKLSYVAVIHDFDEQHFNVVAIVISFAENAC